VLASNSIDAMANKWLAVTLLKLGKENKAAEHYFIALKIDASVVEEDTKKLFLFIWDKDSDK